MTSGYPQIEFTVGQASPQNLKSISVQQFDGANWNEIQHSNCDGGAICPVQQGKNPQIVTFRLLYRLLNQNCSLIENTVCRSRQVTLTIY